MSRLSKIYLVATSHYRFEKVYFYQSLIISIAKFWRVTAWILKMVQRKTERKGENHSNQCQHPQLWAINYNFRMLSFYFFPPCTPCEPHLSGQGVPAGHWLAWSFCVFMMLMSEKEKKIVLCCMAARCAPISGVSGHAWVGCFHMYLKCLGSVFFLDGRVQGTCIFPTCM